MHTFAKIYMKTTTGGL